MRLHCTAAAGVFVHVTLHLAAVCDTEEDTVTSLPLPSLCFGSTTLSHTADLMTITARDTAAVNLNFLDM